MKDVSEKKNINSETNERDVEINDMKCSEKEHIMSTYVLPTCIGTTIGAILVTAITATCYVVQKHKNRDLPKYVPIKKPFLAKSSKDE